MEMMAWLGGEVVDTSTVTVNTFFQLSILTYHNVGTNQPPTRHIFNPSKINLASSRQVGLLKLIPMNQSRKFANLFRKNESTYQWDT